MISVEEAEKIVLKTVKKRVYTEGSSDVGFAMSDVGADPKSDIINPKYTEGSSLLNSVGRILAEDIIADRDFPPFDRVTMDGIAFNFENFKAGQRRFFIENMQAAGEKQLQLMDVAHCIEIMTGAVMPLDCDTVIRYEDLKIENGFAEIQIENVDYQQNTHKKGRDRKAGDVLIPKGKLLSAAEIGTAATVGKSILTVVKLPKVAIISTGNELVAINETPEDHQIRRSNVYSLAALLADKFKIKAQLFHFNDNETDITEGLKKILSKHDLVILSGAVSEGKFDFVPKALASNGVDCLFHKVSQRPGKPLWFGQKANKTVVFGLPGNPVSTFMCACRYVLPWIQAYLTQKTPNYPLATLAEDVHFKPDLTYFLQVKLENKDGILTAHPVAGGGSGDLANLNDADGFLELPIDKSAFLKGEMFKFIGFR
jgi:molybdopterin molybdotransferase